MTSQCLAFSVGRHHSDVEVVSVIQSSLPSYNTDVKSNTDSLGQAFLVNTKEIDASGQGISFDGDQEGNGISSESDLYEEIHEAVYLTVKPNSKDNPEIDTNSGNTLSITSSRIELNTAFHLDATSVESATAVPFTSGSGENELVEVASRIHFTTQASDGATGSMRIKRNADAPNLDHADTPTEEADATATEACRDPSEGELYEMLHGQTIAGSGTEIQHSYLNNTCPASLLERNQKPLESRALCPFVMETDTDVERYPQDILSARCACPDCINPYNNGFIRNPGVDCMPVVREMETLRRGQCVDGVYRYEKQTTKVPVACVCARRRAV
eukprot:XP_011669436.1 PREDICTED: uncharacterized protein LOC105440689 [Strongylocentrotus purpuratus]